MIFPVHLSLFISLLAPLEERSRFFYLPPWKQAEKHILRLHVLHTVNQMKAQKKKERKDAETPNVWAWLRNTGTANSKLRGSPREPWRSLLRVPSTPPSSPSYTHPPTTMLIPQAPHSALHPGPRAPGGERINNGSEGTFWRNGKVLYPASELQWWLHGE